MADQLLQQAQMMQAAQNQTSQLILGVGIQIYSNLVADRVKSNNGKLPSPETLRLCAQEAKAAAPFIAEAYGMLKINVEKTPNVVKE